MAAHQLVRVVELRPGQQVQARRVHHNGRAVASDHDIVRLRRIIELKPVLKPAASASKHGHPQRPLPPFGGDDLGNLRGGPFSDPKIWSAIRVHTAKIESDRADLKLTIPKPASKLACAGGLV